MARFSDVTKGRRARTPAVLPLPGAHVDPETGEWIGPTAKLAMRALREDEYDDVLANARAFAKKRGESAEDGDDLYERGKMLHTLAIACLDADSPEDVPALFFDGGVDQIASSEIMCPEVIAYLYERQQLWQDEVNPLLKALQPNEFFAAAVAVAGGNMAFFVGMRPGMRWSFTRTLASQLLSSLANSSSSTPSSEPQTTTKN